MADIIISKPKNGENITIVAEQSDKILLSFETEETTVQRVDGDLVLDFGQGATVTISGFYTVSDNGAPPALVLNGKEISTEEFFEAMADTLQPASGEQSAQVLSGGSSLTVEKNLVVQEESTLNGVGEDSEETDALTEASTLVNSLLADDAVQPLSLDNSFNFTSSTVVDEQNTENLNVSSTTPSGPQVYYGTSGDDNISVVSGEGIVFGLAGNDTLTGNNGDDWLYGGAGDDLLYGGAGDDILFGDSSDSVIQGGEGNDVIVLDTLTLNDVFDSGIDGGVGMDILLSNVQNLQTLSSISTVQDASIEMYVLGASSKMMTNVSKAELLQDLGMTVNNDKVSFEDPQAVQGNVQIAGVDYSRYDVSTDDNINVTVLISQTSIA